jgi:4-hydroxythreonine-4-phosphate dehydrogenase
MEIAGVDFPVKTIGDLSEAGSLDDGCTLLDLPGIPPSAYTLGEVNREAGALFVKTFKQGLDWCKEGKLDGLLHGPFNKVAMVMAGEPEIDPNAMIAQHLKFDRPFGEINILGDLWTCRVTSHIPFKDVSSRLTVERILNTILFANKSASMAKAKPRLAVCGLNPHNGELGRCGTEEIEVIAPAVEKARGQGIDVVGPFAADTLFNRAFKGEFDLVVTMYHDQGQIAIKTKDFHRVVTLTGGLDFPLTTPAHGTAFDIAGKGVADPGPSLSALEVTVAMVKNRGR